MFNSKQERKMIARMVEVKLVNGELLGAFYVTEDAEALARKLLAEGYYKTAAEFAVLGEGESAAEEAFDLTNNPSRQDERAQLYGRFRSVSVGDIVTVDGVNWLCMSTGWRALA
jgi:hypothetical protein